MPEEIDMLETELGAAVRLVETINGLVDDLNTKIQARSKRQASGSTSGLLNSVTARVDPETAALPSPATVPTRPGIGGGLLGAIGAFGAGGGFKLRPSGVGVEKKPGGPP